MIGRRRDTLFLRLLLLMVGALLVSHLLAWWVVTRVAMGFLGPAADPPGAPARELRDPPPPGRHAGPPPRPDEGHGAQRPERSPGPPALPRLGTLPPTPGVPDATLPAARAGHGLPTPVLVLDYALRILVIACAAWWGARWLSGPVDRMVHRAHDLADGLARGEPPAPLDDTRGPVELREAAGVFNGMAQRLWRDFRGRGLLMASISHDLRTPLTRMRIRLEEWLPDPRAQRCIDDLHEMNTLIDGAIEVFRAEDPQARPPQTVDLTALVQSLVDDLSEAGVAVPVHGQAPLARARPDTLRRALDNLVANALRHARDASITLANEAGPVVHVDDRGPGVPAAMLDRITDPFFRLDPSRSRGSGGSGLGLHIAQTLIQAQGGRLTLANRPGGGLRASVRLAAAEGTGAQAFSSPTASATR